MYLFCLIFFSFTANSSDKQWAQVTLALYRADYHGAKLEVIRSKCASLCGIKGIILMDTKNTFKLIGQDNVIRSKFFFPPSVEIIVAFCLLLLRSMHS